MSLSRALDLWIEITGVDPSRQSYSYGEWQVRDMHEALKEALELDSTEITGKLLFEHLATTYFKERSFSVETLLETPDQVVAYLEKSRELRQYLRSDDLIAIREDFTAQMKKAVIAYGAHGLDVAKMVQEPHMLAILRRDALRTLNHLQINQFLAGTPEPKGVAPVYGKYVNRWWNINSMLKAMTAMPSGVTVNLICHPTDPYRSYFAFAIRNGGNLFVFTDKEQTPHPLAEDMWRRMDKVLAERAARNWFPYDLMGLAFDEEGRAYVVKTEERGLVPYQSETQSIKAIADLEAPTMLWLAMMLDLIVQKFWREGYCASALSYTGEMVRTETPLIEAAGSANLPVVGYQPLSLAPLTLADVQDEVALETYVGLKGRGENKWMEERYAGQVSDIGLNAVRGPSASLALAFKDGASSLVAIDCEEESRLTSWELKARKKDRVDLDSLDATGFGTREELEANRLFLARGNYAKQIERLAVKEFEDRRTEIMAWVRAKVEANLPALYPLMTRPAVFIACEPFNHSASRGAFTWRGKTKDGFKRRFVVRESLTGDNEWRKGHLSNAYTTGNLAFRGEGYKNGVSTCFHTNAPSAVTVQFCPETTEDLAFICGCTVAELPDVLQHWTLVKHYVGNAILQRIDPMEWQCKNPWRELHFELFFFFSVRARAALEKQYGSVPIGGLDQMFWCEEPEANKGLKARARRTKAAEVTGKPMHTPTS